MNAQVGSVVLYCDNRKGYRHNALIIGAAHDGSFVALVHIVNEGRMAMPQVELEVPWSTPDEDGRYWEVVNT